MNKLKTAKVQTVQKNEWMQSQQIQKKVISFNQIFNLATAGREMLLMLTTQKQQ